MLGFRMFQAYSVSGGLMTRVYYDSGFDDPVDPNKSLGPLFPEPLHTIDHFQTLSYPGLRAIAAIGNWYDDAPDTSKTITGDFEYDSGLEEVF